MLDRSITQGEERVGVNRGRLGRLGKIGAFVFFVLVLGEEGEGGLSIRSLGDLVSELGGELEIVQSGE